MKLTLTVFVPSNLSQSVIELAASESIRASSPRPLESPTDLLNAGVSPSDIKDIIEIITLIIGTGTAGLGFLIKLRALLKPGQRVPIKDIKTNKRRLALTNQTSDAELDDFVGTDANDPDPTT